MSEPLVPSASDVQTGDGWLNWRPGDARAVPRELVIRELRALDLDDPGEVAAFFQTHGAPTSEGPAPAIPGAADFRVSSIHVDQFVPRLTMLRMCADHVVAVSKGEPTWPIWFADRDDPDEDELERLSAGKFVQELNDSLRNSHARLVITFDAGSPREQTYGDLNAGLLDAMAVQLFNIVIEHEVPLRVCPNCDGVFQRQRGRAKQGQHRSTGVTYCSQRCANAANNREYRKRKRQGKS